MLAWFFLWLSYSSQNVLCFKLKNENILYSRNYNHNNNGNKWKLTYMYYAKTTSFINITWSKQNFKQTNLQKCWCYVFLFFHKRWHCGLYTFRSYLYIYNYLNILITPLCKKGGGVTTIKVKILVKLCLIIKSVFWPSVALPSCIVSLSKPPLKNPSNRPVYVTLVSNNTSITYIRVSTRGVPIPLSHDTIHITIFGSWLQYISRYLKLIKMHFSLIGFGGARIRTDSWIVTSLVSKEEEF
jgi:hypothetical protein